MRKICVVLTARTSYAKIKPILTAIEAHPDLELQVLCAASAVLERFGQADKIVEEDGFTINERIFMVLEGETLLTSVKSTGYGIIEFSSALNRLEPDAVLVMADRYEVLAPAIAASYLNIPLIHVQGGEVSGNIDEKVRHAITKLADIHFPATERAREWIIRMGENPDKVINSGCPSIDLAQQVIDSPQMNFNVYEKYGGVGSKPDLSNGYLITMQHPVTTEVNEARKQITETLKAVDAYGKPVLFFWPNADAGSEMISKGIRAFRETRHPNKIHFFKNMQPLDFMRLLYNSEGIVGNSSVAIRECAFLGVPAINIGSRQSNRDRGPNVVDCTYDHIEILKLIKTHCGKRLPSSTMFGDGKAAIKIAETLAKIPLTFSKTLQYAL